MTQDTHIVEEFANFVAEFKDESDRAIVVLTAARLDLLLMSVLQKHLRPSPAKTDDFFENQGPGATLSGKIMLANRLGLIDDDFARALNLVRRIRNDFAHETSACSLEQGGHLHRVRALAAPYQKHPFYPWFGKKFFHSDPPGRTNFMTSVGILILRLEFLLSKLDTIDYSKATPVIPKSEWPIKK